jgi:hypothetical protein
MWFIPLGSHNCPRFYLICPSVRLFYGTLGPCSTTKVKSLQKTRSKYSNRSMYRSFLGQHSFSIYVENKCKQNNAKQNRLVLRKHLNTSRLGLTEDSRVDERSDTIHWRAFIRSGSSHANFAFLGR